MTLPPFLVVALSGMEDAVRQAGMAAAALPFVLLAVVWLVLKLDDWGWLP